MTWRKPPTDYRRAEDARVKAREKPRAAVNAATDEGIPLARIARTAGIRPTT
jgi:hypothetical protein